MKKMKKTELNLKNQTSQILGSGCSLVHVEQTKKTMMMMKMKNQIQDLDCSLVHEVQTKTTMKKMQAKKKSQICLVDYSQIHVMETKKMKSQSEKDCCQSCVIHPKKTIQSYVNRRQKMKSHLSFLIRLKMKIHRRLGCNEIRELVQILRH